MNSECDHYVDYQFGDLIRVELHCPRNKLEENFAHVENRRAKTRVQLGHLLGSAELCECPSVFAVGPVCD